MYSILHLKTHREIRNTAMSLDAIKFFEFHTLSILIYKNITIKYKKSKLIICLKVQKKLVKFRSFNYTLIQTNFQLLSNSYRQTKDASIIDVH